MTDQEINIAIAESVGWKPKRQVILCTCQDCGEFNCSKDSEEEMPNYVADLNAMNEVEKRLSSEELHAYANHLFKVVLQAEMDWAFLASARQRAKAYLKTIGKWKETTPTP